MKSKVFLILSLLFFTIGLAKTFDPTKLSDTDFAVVANIMGMTTVFVVLTILAFVITITGKLIISSEKRTEKRHIKEIAVQTITQEPLKQSNNDTEEAAAIVAAIYSVLDNKNVKIRYRLSSNDLNSWKRISMNKLNGRKRSW